ncbi:MAG: M48 family metallopeptidase [Eubacteriaceae bacterium]|jgi:predicted metal-dependent hydrolase
MRRPKKKTTEYKGRPVEITRRTMKNMILRVGPGGLLKVSCPFQVSDAAVFKFIDNKSGWIDKQEPPAPEPEFRDGAVISFFGERLHINAMPGIGPSIREDKQLRVFVKNPADSSQIEKKTKDYLRGELKDYIGVRIPLWEERVGENCSEWNVRDMRSRWGSCNTASQKLLFSLKLTSYPRICTDLVIVHELAHLVERNHNPRFYNVMDEAMPGWRMTSQLLK